MVILLTVIAGGVFIFGFLALGRILSRAFWGPKDYPGSPGLWQVVGAGFGIGVLMLIILAILRH
jgi:hypothetical protein